MLVFGVVAAVAAVLAYAGHWYLNIRRLIYQWKKLSGQQVSIWSQVRKTLRYSALKNKHHDGLYFLRNIRKQNAIRQREGLNVLWIGMMPLLHVFSPELVEKVLKDSGSINRSSDYAVLNKWFGHGLFTSSGSKWRIRRRLYNQCFSRSILENILPVLDELARLFVVNIDEHRRGADDHLDVWPLLNQLTLDIVCETILGFPCGAQKGQNSDYIVANHNVEKIVMKRLHSQWLYFDFLFNLSKIGREFNSHMCVINNFARKVVRDRIAATVQQRGREADGRRRAVLDQFIDLHLGGAPITEQDIQEEVKLILFAGQDSTAVGLTFILYLVGQHPEVQERLHEELDALFPDKGRTTTMDDVRDLKYLECVIKETLRLYAPAGLPGKKIDKDIEHKGFVIPRGTDVYISLLNLHRDPDSFAEPEVFDPDRFLPENSAKRHPYAYIPFLSGPRICVGHKVAMLELKVIISNVLRRFRIVKALIHEASAASQSTCRQQLSSYFPRVQGIFNLPGKL